MRGRVSLAAALFSSPDLLLLDEPTNHLDMDTIEALVTTLKEFNGGIVIVTHDQYLVEQVCNKLYAIDRKRHIQRFEGSFSDYKKSALVQYTPFIPAEEKVHESCGCL